MKTTTLAVLSALLISAASPVFALSHQERLACAWTAGNCLNETRIPEKGNTEVTNDIRKMTNGSSDEVKVLEQKLLEIKAQLESIKGK